MEQPQLLQIPLDDKDVVYTPDWVAADMVDFFKPSGRILEPCKGNGVFLKYLPTAEWCEIQEGRDFFAWSEHVDWIITNPPFAQFGKFVTHSMSLSDNIVFLVPCYKVFNAYKTIVTIFNWGGIRYMRVFGPGGRLGFSYGYSIAAFHFQKGYKGPMYSSIYQLPSTNPDKPDDAHRIG